MNNKMLAFAFSLFACINMSAHAGLPTTLDKPVAYASNANVSDEFRSKCSIDTRMSDRLNKSLNPYGQTSTGDGKAPSDIDRKSTIDSRLRVQILNLFGTDVWGGEKAITVQAQLFENGKQVRETTFTRNAWSIGVGAFKDACQFFEKAADGAANELTRWVRNPMYIPAKNPIAKNLGS